MKKLVFILSFIAISILVYMPKSAQADEGDCSDELLICGNGGGSHYVEICDEEDLIAWKTILCYS